MPKERTHWHLARRAAEGLGSGPLADAVLGYNEFLLAGAVSHDTGFYALGDPRAQAAADRLHGARGQDSFAPLRALAREAAELGAPGLAFGLGALTHLAADVTFHPLVFSWTGDAQALEPELRSGWLYRHQACETALDEHLQSLWGPAPGKTFASLVRRAGKDLRRVHGVFTGEDSWRWVGAHARLQGLFHHRSLKVAARWLAGGRRHGEGDWSAAFYSGPPYRRPLFEGTLTWVDPVTGEPGRATLEELVARYDALIRDLAAAWEGAWAGGGFYEGRVGPALDTGIAADLDQTKRHFEPRKV